MATFSLDSETDWLKRNFTFVNGSDYGHKSGGANGTFDAFAFAKAMFLRPGTDQSFRWLTKNYTQLWAIGLCNYPTTDYTQMPLCMYGEQSNGNLRVYEYGVLKTTVTNKVNENSEPRIQLVEVGGVLTAYCKIRDGVGQTENTVWTSSMTDAELRKLFPIGCLACLGGLNGTANLSAGFEYAQIEGDSDKVGDLESLLYTLPNDPIELFTDLTIKSGGLDGGKKELPNHTIFYKGETLNNAANGLAVFKAMKDWQKITGIKLSVLPENTINSNREFNLRKNGTNIFESNISLPANQQKVDVTELNISVAEDDVFVLDYKSNGKQLKPPLFLELAIE